MQRAAGAPLVLGFVAMLAGALMFVSRRGGAAPSLAVLAVEFTPCRAVAIGKEVMSIGTSIVSVANP